MCIQILPLHGFKFDFKLENLSALKNILHSISPISDEAWSAILEVGEVREYRAGEAFSASGKTCKKLGFLLSGMARFYHDIDGKEITNYFYTTHRNRFVADFVSLLKAEPAKGTVHFLSSSEVFVIGFEDLQHLYQKHSELERTGRIMAEQNYLLAMERIALLQTENAQSRYLDFMNIYPNLLNRIPHHFIASYLAITPESLSRIRRSIAKS